MKRPVNFRLHDVNGVLDAKSQSKGKGQQPNYNGDCENYPAVELAHCDTHHARLETQRCLDAKKNEQGEDCSSDRGCVITSVDSREISTEDGVSLRERAGKEEALEYISYDVES